MGDVSPFEQILLGNNVDPESVIAADMNADGNVDDVFESHESLLVAYLRRLMTNLSVRLFFLVL